MNIIDWDLNIIINNLDLGMNVNDLDLNLNFDLDISAWTQT